MIMEKEWNADKKDKVKAQKLARKQPWYSGDKYPFFLLLLENDHGERVEEYAFWTGYFYHLVGCDIVSAELLSCKTR
jgi:hypothetical protein